MGRMVNVATPNHPTTEGGDDGTDKTRSLLATYLQDHRAGAEAGVALARRLAGAEEGVVGERLTSLADDIEADRTQLDEIMDELEVSPSMVKGAVARVAEIAGRFKLNGWVIQRSPLSSVLELEALSGGIVAKRRLWETLEQIPQLPESIHRRAADLIARAGDQLEVVAALHVDAASRAFGINGVSPTG